MIKWGFFQGCIADEKQNVFIVALFVWKRVLSFASLFPKFLQQSEMGQIKAGTWNSIQISQVGERDPNTWTVTYSLLEYTELGVEPGLKVRSILTAVLNAQS